LPIPNFDAFIAVDWSGAVRGYDGIAVAICRNGRTAPRLISPPGVHWTREEIAQWLTRLLAGGQRLLIGFDFAFSFPYEECGYLGGQARGIDNTFALWEMIEATSSGDSDFGCSQFLGHPNFAPLFWKAGPKPERWIARKRRTEHACAESTQTHPDTLYKLLHSKQVGKASITGMRVLHHLRSSKGDCVVVWPFEIPTSSAMVEIYPTMFRKLATRSIAKLRSTANLNAALVALGSRPLSAAPDLPLSDHETDALVSAAGLRSIAGKPQVWAGRELKSPRVQREGWIFGI
jgi:hypothetical protein